MKTIAFYSYKGGVGRSLLLANIARYLTRFGKKVFCIDFDLEAPGLHYKFGHGSLSQDEVRKGLIDIIEQDVEKHEPPSSLESFVIRMDTPPGDGQLWLLPAGKAPSSEYWTKLTKINWHELFYGAEPEGPLMFLDLKAQIEKEYSPDYVLIDARTGITEMGGAATSILADQIVVLLMDSDEHLEGSRAVLRAFTSYKEPSPRISVVLSRLPADAGEREDAAVSAHVCGELNKGISREDTSFISRVLPLHNDPDVSKKERVLLASEPSESQRILFRDYLRLVLALFGPEEVEQHLSSLVEKARIDLLVSPDESEKILEDIVRIAPHTDALSTLLRLYRVRNRTAGRVEDVLRQILAIEGSRRLDLVALWDAFAFWFEPMPSMGQLTGASKIFFELWKQSQFSDFQTGLFFYHQLKKYSQVGTPLSAEWLGQWEREEWLDKITAKGDLKIPSGVLSQRAQVFLTCRFGFDCFDVAPSESKSFFFSYVDGWIFNKDVRFVRFFLEHLEYPRDLQRRILEVALDSILHWIRDEKGVVLLKPFQNKIYQIVQIIGHSSRQFIENRFSSVKSLEIASNLDKRGRSGGQGGGR